jgi:hypothetical protein
MRKNKNQNQEQKPKVVSKLNKILDKEFETLTLLERLIIDIEHSKIFSKRRDGKGNLDQYNELKKIRDEKN